MHTKSKIGKDDNKASEIENDLTTTNDVSCHIRFFSRKLSGMKLPDVL